MSEGKIKEVQIKGGLSADEFCEREAGGPHHIAFRLAELGVAVEATREEWKYDESSEAVELVRLCAALDDYLKGLSIIPETGALTQYRECARCGGAGHTLGENPCLECGGAGSIRHEVANV